MKVRGHIIVFFCLCVASSSLPVAPYSPSEKEKMVEHLITLNVPRIYLDIVADALIETKIPPILFTRLIATESNWNPKAIGYNLNGTRDQGLAQLNSKYISTFYKYNNGNPVDPHDPSVAIPVSARHLVELYRLTKTWWGAIMAYNCGYSRFLSGNIPMSTVFYARKITEGIE